jgi:photosystem II stability/assembly factor-like uncharacterized protein
MMTGRHAAPCRNWAVFCLLLQLTAMADAQSHGRLSNSSTNENLRGVSVVSRDVAWASGTHGTYLITRNAGGSWSPGRVPGGEGLDFRAVTAFSADEAFLMSSGAGDLSRIYHTSDGGQHWQLQFSNANSKGFFDAMVFWDPTHGVVLGDPIADEAGKLKFEILVTDDGQNWHAIAPAHLPPALEGEGGFAASNTCLAIVPKEAGTSVGTAGENSDANVWFATGGTAARVFHSGDRGRSWEVFNTPIVRGADSTGIFSIAFRDAQHGVIAGGDYKHPKDDGPYLAFTDDGGRTWRLSEIHPQAYFSAVAYDRLVNGLALQQEADQSKAEGEGKKIRIKPAPPQRLFVVGPDFVFDFRPPANPRRIGASKKFHAKFNAVAAFPDGGALVVGPQGTIAFIR